MFKKVGAILLSTLMLLSTAACATSSSPDGTVTPPTVIPPTATPPENKVELPSYSTETVALRDLAGYKIVYPSVYSEYRQEDVKLLQRIIKDITGISLDIISDETPQSGKEIIIASSKRENGVEEAVEMFESGFDYVVGVRNGNIVLGGNNFYADMKAIYQFINNILGYDDIEKKQIDGKTELSGVNYYIYEKPPIMITGSNYSVSGFTEQFVFRDMQSAHFNAIIVESWAYETDEKLFNFLKWCARYEILAMFRGSVRNELLIDCPAVYSTLVIDEPGPSKFEDSDEIVKAYVESYSKYGWKPFVNFTTLKSHIDPLIEWQGYFEDVPMLSFDTYPGHSVAEYWGDSLDAYERLHYIARQTKQDLWVYIESYNMKNNFELGYPQNWTKMFRWHAYMALTFGAKNILYFQYGDASPNYTAEGDWSFGSLINWDFTKNPAWDHAQKFNEELLNLAPIYNNYASMGACTLNAPPYEPNLNFNSPYPYATDIIPEYICEDEKNSDTYLIGFFDKKDDDKAHALTIMNISDLNGNPYESDDASYVKFKINGENVTFYRNGIVEKVEKTEDGYYRVNMANGYCWFVTVD